MGIIHSFATVLIDSTHPESTGSYKALTKPIGIHFHFKFTTILSFICSFSLVVASAKYSRCLLYSPDYQSGRFQSFQRLRRHIGCVHYLLSHLLAIFWFVVFSLTCREFNIICDWRIIACPSSCSINYIRRILCPCPPANVKRIPKGFFKSKRHVL